MNVRVAEIDDAGKLSVPGATVWIDSYATSGVNENLADHVFSALSPDSFCQRIANTVIIVAEEQGHLPGYAVVEQGQHQKAELKAYMSLLNSWEKGKILLF